VGEETTTLATGKLEDKDIEIAVDADSDQRGYVGRLLVHMYVNEENINHRLLADGYT